MIRVGEVLGLQVCANHTWLTHQKISKPANEEELEGPKKQDPSLPPPGDL